MYCLLNRKQPSESKEFLIHDNECENRITTCLNLYKLSAILNAITTWIYVNCPLFYFLYITVPGVLQPFCLLKFTKNSTVRREQYLPPKWIYQIQREIYSIDDCKNVDIMYLRGGNWNVVMYDCHKIKLFSFNTWIIFCRMYILGECPHCGKCWQSLVFYHIYTSF